MYIADQNRYTSPSLVALQGNTSQVSMSQSRANHKAKSFLRIVSSNGKPIRIGGHKTTTKKVAATIAELQILFLTQKIVKPLKIFS